MTFCLSHRFLFKMDHFQHSRFCQDYLSMSEEKAVHQVVAVSSYNGHHKNAESQPLPVLPTAKKQA